jgi:2-polyprenyl-3-methyl-5-hydroxy-6-metoxy-1,4-benzoquinol methylase
MSPVPEVAHAGRRDPQGQPAGGGPAEVPTGNTFDKYGSTNPVVRRLMSGFEGTLARLFTRAAPESVLDVGCGEGVLTYRWAEQLGTRPVLGVDLADPKLEAEWSIRARSNLEFRSMSAVELRDFPFPDASFDLVAAIEVLEHVPDPERTVAEMARVAARHLLVSVPREPLWRALNVARGAYVRDLGNTPGHVNHWSKRSFVDMLGRHGEVVDTRSPFPWTMVLVRVR